MSNSLGRKASPMSVCPTLRWGCKGCKNKDCDKHEVKEEEITAEDIDHGNYIIGPDPNPTGPIPMASPKEMTPSEWARHRVTHLPFNCSCPHCAAGESNICTIEDCVP